MFVQRWVGGLSQKHTPAYREGGLVRNVMILSIRTLWMTPDGTVLLTPSPKNYFFHFHLYLHYFFKGYLLYFCR